jgi:hypothetical protein
MLLIPEFSPQKAKTTAIDKSRGCAFLLAAVILPDTFRTCKHYPIVVFGIAKPKQ